MKRTIEVDLLLGVARLRTKGTEGRNLIHKAVIMIRTFLLIIGVTVAVGCAPSPNQRQTSQSGALDETKVLAIARMAVATNDTWIDRAVFERPEREADGSWTVSVWRRPATPGGDRLITIDEKGTVIRYIRGL